MSAALLEINDLCAFYGPTQVLHGIDLRVVEQGVTTLLGANGAGKSTTLKAICGLVQCEGSIRFADQQILAWSTDAIVRSGIALVPEGRGTFMRLTVEENLRLGAYSRTVRKRFADNVDKVYHYFPALQARRTQQAGTLSGGEQQMLAIGRALMLEPRLLILDEPSFGLAPRIVETMFEIMKTIREEQSVSLLLVEQNASAALAIADEAYLLETGRVVISGEPERLSRDETIRRSYLGY